MDVSWWLLAVLAQVMRGSCDAHDVTVTLNTLWPVTHTSNNFLGISTSLGQLLNNDQYSAATVNMLQAMSPGYLRVGGAETDNLTFRTLNTSSGSQQLLTESQWANINQLAADTGLHLVFNLSPEGQTQSQLLSFSDQRGYNVSWQLGYRTTNIHELTGNASTGFGLKLSNLRQLIDSFPRYHHTAVLGPDMEICENEKCLEALKELLQQLKDVVDVVILEMKPDRDLKDLKNMFEKLENVSGEIQKTPFYREIPLQRNKKLQNKNIWIAETTSDVHSGGLTEALSCALTLGHAGRLGYHTVLLQLPQLSQPTPSFWTALLYKVLVGQAVLSTRVLPQNDKVVVFAACTAAEYRPALDTEWEYDSGTVTLWGTNLAEENAHITLRTGSRLEHVHLYILTYDGRNKGNILLNGQPLRMVHGVLPKLSPRIRMTTRSTTVTVPAQSIFFIVIPDAQAPACLLNTGERLLGNLKSDDVSHLLMNVPHPTSKTPSPPRKIEMNLHDMFIANGGVYPDATVIRKGLAMELRSDDKINSQERFKAFVNDEKQLEVTKLKKSEELVNQKKNVGNFGNIMPNEQQTINYNENNNLKLSEIKSSENSKRLEDLAEDLMLTNVNFEEERSKDNNPLSETSVHKNDTFQPTNSNSSLSDSIASTIKKTSEVPRVKRSEAYNYFEYNRPRDTETSPLYRRVNLLKRILKQIQQSKRYEHEEQDRYFRDFPAERRDFSDNLETERVKNKQNTLKSRGKYNEHPAETPSNRINSINKEPTPSVATDKEVENINYQPGEFYEILGGLKIDSNVSLKDKEEELKDGDSMQKQPRPSVCTDGIESKLTVTKKPKNDPQEDRRLVEQATEKSRQYYLKSNYSNVQQVKTEKPEIRNLKNREDELSLAILKEDSSENKQTELNQEEYLQNIKKVQLDGETMKSDTQVKRTIREVNNLEEEDLKTLQLTPNYEEHNRKYDYSDDVELGRFLEELTSEGEELLQTIDEEYESNIRNESYGTGFSHDTTEYIPKQGDNKTLFGEYIAPAENKTEEPDFYLKNNIVIDKEMKPRKRFQTGSEQAIDYSPLDKTDNELTNSEMEMKNQLSSTTGTVIGTTTSETDFLLTSGQSKPAELTTLGDLYDKYSRSNSSSSSITEGINNSDMFIENVPQTYMSTKPGINLTTGSRPETENEEATENNLGKYSGINNTISKEFNRTENKSMIGYETDKHDLTYNSGKEDTILTTTYSGLIKDTVKSTVDVELVENKKDSIFNTSNYQIKYNNSNIKNSPLIVEDNKHEVSHSYYQGKKLVSSGESVFTPKAPDYINSTTEKSGDENIKIDSESNLVNKVLPPPLKPTLILRSLSVPSVITLNRNLTMPRKIDVINNRIEEFNSKHKLTAPVLERSFPSNKTFSDRYKERLDIIKQRLHLARERLLNLTTPSVTSNIITKPIKVKREIDSKDFFNSLLNNKKAEIQTEKPLFVSSSDKDTIRQVSGSAIKYQPSDNLYNLFKREVDVDDQWERSSMASDLDRHRSADSMAEADRQALADVPTPYYFSAIKKWVIPLGNGTENMFYNNKLFPVSLFGIVSDKWVQENIGRQSETEKKRRRRSLQYPCVKDRFNDFEAEDKSNKFQWSSNVQSGKRSIIRKTDSLIDLVKTPPEIISPQIHSDRLKRAASKDIEMNEMEIKALLTNEIIKEKPEDDVSDHENVVSSMLHKTLHKTVSNKTGFERMLELAKQYQETNPSSIEIFSTKNKKHQHKKLNKIVLDKSEEENTAIEVATDTNLERSPSLSRKGQSDSFNMFDKAEEGNKSTELTDNKNSIGSRRLSKKNQTDRADVTPGNLKNVVNSLTTVETTSTESERSTDSSTKDEHSSNRWSDFTDKVKDFFESVMDMIQKEIN